MGIDHLIISKTEAKELHLKKYFTGKSCNKGHLTERYTTNGKCVLCCSERSSAAYLRNREKILEKTATKYLRDHTYRELKKEYIRGYYQLNRERCISQSKLWVQQNRETSRITKASWKRLNSGKVKESNKRDRINNSGRVNFHSKTRQELKRNRVPAWANLGLISNIYLRCKEISESTNVPHHVDHILPLRGKLVSGLHVIENLRIIPASENIKKGNKLLEEFINVRQS